MIYPYLFQASVSFFVACIFVLLAAWAFWGVDKASAWPNSHWMNRLFGVCSAGCVLTSGCGFLAWVWGL